MKCEICNGEHHVRDCPDKYKFKEDVMKLFLKVKACLRKASYEIQQSLKEE